MQNRTIILEEVPQALMFCAWRGNSRKFKCRPHPTLNSTLGIRITAKPPEAPTNWYGVRCLLPRYAYTHAYDHNVPL